MKNVDSKISIALDKVVEILINNKIKRLNQIYEYKVIKTKRMYK